MVPEDEPGKPQRAPIEMQAQPDKEGYFNIQNLKKDRDYVLIVTGREGETTVAQVAVATPPNPRMRIQLDEGVAQHLPELPALFQQIRRDKRHVQPANNEVPTASLDNPQSPTSAPLAPNRSPGWDVQIDTPIPGRDGNSGAPSPGASRPAGYVATPSNWPPAAEWKWQPPPRDTRDSRPPPPSPSPPLDSSLKLPACNLEGDKLVSFSVRDLSGQMYEFNREQHPKLVLLQFWHTTCPPCLASIPWMKQWQTTYGKYGLEIIGICYENGSLVEQANKVDAVAARHSVHGFNYQILLGGNSATCPLHRKLQVEAYPTFVLLDQTGHIVFHTQGFDAQSLERAIRNNLGMR